jgi:choice-of-anchor A domain-containing protein
VNNYSGLAIMQNSKSIKGNIVYKGEYKDEPARIWTKEDKDIAKLWTNGDITWDPNLDLSEYEDNLEELKVKSHYWSTLDGNGKYTPYNKGPNGNTCLFEAVDDECVQVFNLSNDEFDNLPWGIHVQFHESLKDKTVIINMASDSNKESKVTNLANFFDPWGKGGWEFDSGFIANILWNFHDAEIVDLGGGTTGTGEFTGSIIVPNGDLKMGFPGQSGRTIVGGDLTQDRAGSEFHSFPYDPVCALPLPKCEPSPGPTPAPTQNPTPVPTPGPTPVPTPNPTPGPTRNPTPGPTAAPTASPTKRPTPGPTPGPTRNPTPGPTAAPTKSPTPGPTPDPTPAPTGGFLSGPYPGYTPLGGPSTTTVGVSQPNGGNPLVIGEQTCAGDISFGLTNTWGTSIDYIFVQYKDLTTGLLVCEAFKNVTTSWFVEFSSKCRRVAPISIVTITAVDSSFSAGDTASLLDCCGDNEILGEISGATQKIVTSTYVLDCCPEEEVV